jgi:hypothetical protein
MRNWFVAIICSAGIGILALTSPVSAQQKTVKACQEEWQANKVANQAKGITLKAYVAQCRAAAAASEPKAAPARKAMAPAKSSTQAKGITLKAYVAQCRAGTAAVQPRASPAAAPPARARPPAPAAATPARPAVRSEPARGTPAGANQFDTESAAKARCRSDTVVWANLDSKIYHFAGHNTYGHTKTGAYMCEKDAVGQGMRAAKNEKRP